MKDLAAFLELVKEASETKGDKLTVDELIPLMRHWKADILDEEWTTFDEMVCGFLANHQD